MAGEWIKVERATPDKPEVLRIARELCIDRDAVFGKLMLVWMWFDANSYNGVVDGAVDADVDALARQKDFAAQMRAVGWLTDALTGNGLCIPNFNRHNGETTKKRALSNRRQAKWRNSRVDGTASTNASTREEKRRSKEQGEPAKAGPVFGESLQILLDGGLSEPSARGFLGLMCRDYAEADVVEAVKAAVGKVNATAYIRGVLKSYPKKGDEQKKQVAL